MIEWYYLVLISSLIMGFSSIYEKRVLKNNHATAYSASFSLVVAILSLLFLPFANFKISIYEILGIYALSLISSSTYLFTARIYKHGNITVSTPVLSSLPQFFIVILAFIFLGEKLSVIQYIAIAVLLVATYVIIIPGKRAVSKSFESKKYVYLLVLTTVLMAMGGIIMKYLLTIGVNLFTLLILLEFFIAFNLTAYISLRYGGIVEELANLRHNKLPITVIAIMSVSYRILYYASLQTAYVSLASPLRNSISVVVTVIIGGLIFKESSIAKKMLLAAIMIAAVYFIIQP